MDEPASQRDIERLRQDIAALTAEFRSDSTDHRREDNKRFGEVMSQIAEVSEDMSGLKEDRAKHIGAAQAIAEISARQATKNTLIVSIIAVVCALLTLMIQKHWI